MRTDICTISSDFADITAALEQTERCGRFIDLDHKQQIRLRLLAEELLGIVRGILGDCDAEFFIEARGKSVELHLRADCYMGILPSEREQLISVSSSGKNAAELGFMGKLRALFEGGVYCGESGLAAAESMFYSSSVNDSSLLSSVWSLQAYKQHLNFEPPAEVWDELEKSIVANIADDVTVSVIGDKTEIVIKKKFN